MDTILELKDVRKSYLLGETTVSALCGVNFKLCEGEFAAIVGASGSGKSTLLNIVGCIDQPDEGEVLVAGHNVQNLSDDGRSRLRNRLVGFVFQSFNLVPVLNVFENVELPLSIRKEVSRKERKERVMGALDAVGLLDRQHHLPDKLSGGQRQRVAIARALVTRPHIVLADEPTANLDSVTAQKILELMREINAKTKVTFLFSTHDERLMSCVSRIVRLQDGQIIN